MYDPRWDDAREREDECQAFYAGVNRPRELDHDAHLYAAYREEHARLRQEHGHVEVRRVVLEQDLKRDYQDCLQDHNRDRSESDGRPDRDEEEIRRWVQDHELPYFDETRLPAAHLQTQRQHQPPTAARRRYAHTALHCARQVWRRGWTLGQCSTELERLHS
jgi:hypothetical protein